MTTGTTRSSEGLAPDRRRALYRAWHRGMREMDLVLGRFADAEIARMDESAFADFERLMEVPDPDLFNWVTGSVPVPTAYDTALFRQLKAFSLSTPRESS